MVTFSMHMVLLSKEGETEDRKITFTHVKEGVAIVAWSVLMGSFHWVRFSCSLRERFVCLFFLLFFLGGSEFLWKPVNIFAFSLFFFH